MFQKPWNYCHQSSGTARGLGGEWPFLHPNEFHIKMLQSCLWEIWRKKNSLFIEPLTRRLFIFPPSMCRDFFVTVCSLLRHFLSSLCRVFILLGPNFKLTIANNALTVTNPLTEAAPFFEFFALIAMAMSPKLPTKIVPLYNRPFDLIFFPAASQHCLPLYSRAVRRVDYWPSPPFWAFPLRVFFASPERMEKSE